MLIELDESIRRIDRCASNVCSVDAFILHPLAVHINLLHQTIVWGCRQPIPEPETYQIIARPAHRPTHVPEAMGLTTTWMNRRGVNLFGISMGVLDTERRRIYPIDVVGSRDGRLVLGILYCTDRRGAGWDQMAEHADEIARVARETYGADPIMALLNISNGGRLQGLLWGENM